MYEPNIYRSKLVVEIDVFALGGENHAKQRLTELFKDRIQIYSPDEPNRPNVIGVVQGIEIGFVERVAFAEESERSTEHPTQES